MELTESEKEAQMLAKSIILDFFGNHDLDIKRIILISMNSEFKSEIDAAKEKLADITLLGDKAGDIFEEVLSETIFEDIVFFPAETQEPKDIKPSTVASPSVELSQLNVEQEVSSYVSAVPNDSVPNTTMPIGSIELPKMETEKRADIEEVETKPANSQVVNSSNIETPLVEQKEEDFSMDPKETSPIEEPAEVKTPEITPAEKPAEVKTPEITPVEKPAEVKTPEITPVEKPAEVKTPEITPVEKPAEVKTHRKPMFSPHTVSSVAPPPRRSVAPQEPSEDNLAEDGEDNLLDIDNPKEPTSSENESIQSLTDNNNEIKESDDSLFQNEWTIMIDTLLYEYRSIKDSSTGITIENIPQIREILFQVSDIYSQKLENHFAAYEVLVECLDITPDNTEVMEKLELAVSEIGNETVINQLLEVYLGKIDPDQMVYSGMICYRIAKIYLEQLGDLEQAKEYLEKVVLLDPSHPQAPQLLNTLTI
jgi:Tetratricopeptide repeat